MASLPASRTPVQTTGLAVGLELALLIALFFNPVPDKPAIGTVAAVVALMQMFIPVLAAWGLAQQIINPLLLIFPATTMSSMAFMLPVGPPLMR